MVYHSAGGGNGGVLSYRYAPCVVSWRAVYDVGSACCSLGGGFLRSRNTVFLFAESYLSGFLRQKEDGYSIESFGLRNSDQHCYELYFDAVFIPGRYRSGNRYIFSFQ